MKKIVYAIIILIVLIVKNTETLRVFGLSTGKCITGPIINDFSLDKYNGTWYEIERFSSIFEYNLDCVVSNYSSFNSTVLEIKHHAQFKSHNVSMTGLATILDTQKPNYLKFSFPINLKSQTLLNLEGVYQVWSTDYSNYALVYSCVDKTALFGLVKYKVEQAWILSRTPTLNSTLISQLKSNLTQIDLKNFEKTKQNCF